MILKSYKKNLRIGIKTNLQNFSSINNKNNNNHTFQRGLFGINMFKDSESIKNETLNTLEKCKVLKEQIKNEHSHYNINENINFKNSKPRKNLIQILENIDKISNDCCLIIDGCTAIYQLNNKNEDLAESALNSILKINTFFEDLNSDKKFYNKILELAFSDIALSGVLNFTELGVLLDRTVEELSLINKSNKKANINDEDDKDSIDSNKFAEKLENLINSLQNASEKKYSLSINKNVVDNLNSQVLKTLLKISLKNNDDNKEHITNNNNNVNNEDYNNLEDNLTVEFNMLQTVLRKSDNLELRDKAFVALNIYGRENLNKMVEILKLRFKFAKSLNFNSYSEYILRTQTLKITPEKLISMIKELWINLQPNLIAELDYLHKECKNYNNSLINLKYLTSYDIDHLRSQVIDDQIKSVDNNILQKKFITIGNIFTGLKLLTLNLFKKNLEFIFDEDKLKNEQIIHESILHCNLKNISANNDKDDVVLGKVYFDMFIREGKFKDIFSQFTIQGSKELNLFSESNNFRQIPISILSTNLEVTELDLLNMSVSFTDAKNIFHEFGHVMHSLLSKTEFQSISGNRVPLDFAEVPSHLFEYFLFDYNFCKQFFIDQTDKRCIDKNLHNLICAQNLQFSNLELQETLYNSLFDLMIHSHFKNEEDINAENILKLNEYIKDNFYINNLIKFDAKTFEDFNKITDKYKGTINFKYALDKFNFELTKLNNNNNNTINDEKYLRDFKHDLNYNYEVSEFLIKNKENSNFIKEKNERNFKLTDYSFTNSPHFKDYPSNYYSYIFGKVYSNLIWTDCFLKHNNISSNNQSQMSYLESGLLLEKEYLSKGYSDSPINLINNLIRKSNNVTFNNSYKI